MEVIQNSRKRSHRSPPISSTITRSKAKLHFHQNRSGQIRPDAVSKNDQPHSVPVPFAGNNATQGFSNSEYNNLIQDICKIYSESDSEDKISIGNIYKKAKNDNEDSPCASTKDLRMRRVYSSGVIQSLLSNVSAADSDLEELGFGSPSSADVRIESTEVVNLGFSCEPRNLERRNTELSYESPKLQIDGKNGGDFSEKIGDLGEETIVTTPPDAVFCVSVEVNCNASKTEEMLRVEDKPLAGNAGENSGDGRRNSSVLKSKSVLKPRLPGKLFKAPGSVNYKRLMNILGDDFGIPKLGNCQKDKVMDDGSQLPYSPMQLDTEEVNGKRLSVPSVDDKRTSELKVDPAADFLSDSDVGNALDHGDFKQHSVNGNNLDCTKAIHHNGCAPEQLGVLNEGFVPTTCDAGICDNLVFNVDQSLSTAQDACQVKSMDLSRSTLESVVESLSSKADKRSEPLKSRYVHSPNFQGKLIKTPGSVNYRRLLLYLKNVTKYGSGTSKFGDQVHHKKDEADLHAKELQLPLPSPSEEASFNSHMTANSPMPDKVESNALENNILVNPANMLSQPKLTSSRDFSELPMQLDANEVVHECLSPPSVQAHSEKVVIGSVDEFPSESKTDPCSVMMDFDCAKIVTNEVVRECLSAPSVQAHSEKVVIGSVDECSSESKTDPCSVMMDFHCAKIVTNAAHYDGFNQVQNMISAQHSSESPVKDRNLLNSNDGISNLSYDHHSSNEKGYTTVYDEIKQFVNLESHGSEGQHISQLDANMRLKEENETGSHAFNQNDDAVVLSHANISNEEPIPLLENIISEKPDLPLHGDKAGTLLNGVVYGSKTPSKGSSDKNASCAGEIEDGSKSKTTRVLNRCPRIRLFKHAGSFNYKRMLPILLKTVESNSCASNNDHHPNRKMLSPLLPISESNLGATPLRDSNDCVPTDTRAGNYGAQQETELQGCDLNNDSSSPRPRLQDKQIVLNGHHKLENSIGSPITDEVITRLEVATPALSNEEKPLETLGCCQSMTQHNVTEQHRVPAVGFQKGILRRNPRGCRGLCTCLNCVSFRLHAERAFEFSRNQLLDAEEVARDLMKEVSHLRNMLERYTDSVDDTPLFDGSQVKEACMQAFETEQHANDRLSQMKDDLDIHCRTPSLQRPSVKFSDHVEEKFIQPDR